MNRVTWHKTTRRLLDIAFPPRCVGCGARGGWFCVSCLRHIDQYPDPVCGECMLPVNPRAPHGCRTVAKPVTISAIGVYAGPLREAVHVLKYSGRYGVAAVLAEMLVPSTAPLYRTHDLLAPVPLHFTRERERGYNQSAVLAAELARLLPFECVPKALRRTRATRSQTDLPAADRAGNVRGAFAADPGLVAGRCIWLLDDVYTTGSTLNACALALRRAGAREVRAAVVARSTGAGR